jgi:hypothetical protein
VFHVSVCCISYLISSTGFEFMYKLIVIFFLLLHVNGTCLLTSYPFSALKLSTSMIAYGSYPMGV